MADKLIVFGSGGHAKVVVEAVFARTPGREIILFDDRGAIDGRTIFGIGVSGGREQLQTVRNAPVALGVGDNQARFEIMSWLIDHGHSLQAVLHPAAIVAASVEIGPGAFVGAGAVAIADARINAGAIINTSASVDHDCIVGEAAHIAPGARLCGNVEVGARTLVGVGSAVRPGTTICADAVVGAGAVVIADIVKAGTYVGNPARRLR